jgi:hypothetical protein
MIAFLTTLQRGAQTGEKPPFPGCDRPVPSRVGCREESAQALGSSSGNPASPDEVSIHSPALPRDEVSSKRVRKPERTEQSDRAGRQTSQRHTSNRD